MIVASILISKIQMYQKETKMDKLSDTINKLIIDTWGGLVALWTLVVAISFKFFMFLGECMAAGAAKKGVDAAMPEILKAIKEEVAPLKQDISLLKSLLPEYKIKKHTLEGELKSIKQVIIDDDREILEELKKLIQKENENKQS